MPALRVCPEPGCPTLTAGGRCPTHTRPTAYRRGYDTPHRRESEGWKQAIRDGKRVICWRCLKPITDPDDCDLGHVDDIRDTTTQRAQRAPEHARRCNRAEAGRASHA